MTMEKPPYVPTNAELWRELEQLQTRIQSIEFQLRTIKAEQEKLRRNTWDTGR